MPIQFNAILRLSGLFVLIVVGFMQCKKDDNPATPKSSAKELTNPVIEGISSASATFSSVANSYTITIPGGTDLTALKLTYTLSAKATAIPASGSVQNFNNPVTYMVTAEDGSTQTYTVQMAYKSTWATQAERDQAFQNWVSKISGKAPISGTVKLFNGVEWPYGLSDALVAFAINESGFTPTNAKVDTLRVFDNKGNSTGAYYLWPRWTSKPFIGQDKYVMFLGLSLPYLPDKREITVSYSYLLNNDNTISQFDVRRRLTVAPSSVGSDPTLFFLGGTYTY